MMKNIPQKIYLQIGEDAEDVESFDDLSDVTWCADNINQNDIEYVVAGYAAALPIDKPEYKEGDVNEIIAKFTKFADDRWIEKTFNNFLIFIKATYPAQPLPIDKAQPEGAYKEGELDDMIGKAWDKANKEYPELDHYSYKIGFKDSYAATPAYKGDEPMKIVFTDLKSLDDNIPEDKRWMADIKGVAIVTADSKEKAFDEILKSLKVLLAYNSNHQLPPPTQPNSVQEGDGWIRVEDGLPERPEKKQYQNVQCGYFTPKNKFIQFIGFYAEKHKVPFEDYDNDEDNYDPVEEAHGTMYLKEGWYELVETPSGEYDEVYMKRTVTHWQPLPAPPQQ